MTRFDPPELERYARHIVLRHVGGPGQQKLKAARVLVVGAGGLGAPVLQYLAAAGVGGLAIVDDDTVSLSNLQRQVIHRTGDVGRLKVESARDAVCAINPHVLVDVFARRLDERKALEMVRGFDVVVDGSDNFDTRYAVSDACFHAGVTLVTAAVNEFDGSLTTLKPHLSDAAGNPNPTYRCLFPEKPAAGLIPTCADAGVLGALTGMVGTMQAIEALRAIVGFGESMVGKLLLVDALTMRFETIHYAWDPANPLNGSNTALFQAAGASGV
jgi:molybdopterin-synthase adenylyltransferase